MDAVKERLSGGRIELKSADGKTLYVMAINKHFDSPIEATIDVRGFAPAAKATAWTLNGKGIDSHTGTTPLQLPGLKWPQQAEDVYHKRFTKQAEDDVTFSPASVENVGLGSPTHSRGNSVTSVALRRTPDGH